MIRALALLVSLIAADCAAALVGGAPAANGVPAQALVAVVGSRGNFCTGTAIARDVVLTAAHCVLPGADYKIALFTPGREPVVKDTAQVLRHPQFDKRAFFSHRATADIALLKLSEPLPANVSQVPLGMPPKAVQPGDRFIVAGYGVSIRGDGRSGGVARAAALIATGRPGSLQIRLFDPATRGETPGLGACTGDSGAPVFQEIAGRAAIIGLVSWSTGPKLSDGCGGLTGVTPLVRYQDWIARMLRQLGG